MTQQKKITYNKDQGTSEFQPVLLLQVLLSALVEAGREPRSELQDGKVNESGEDGTEQKIGAPYTSSDIGTEQQGEL